MKKFDFGSTKLVKYYEFYDRPVLGLISDDADNKALFVLVRQVRGNEQWFCRLITEKRLARLEAGKLSLYDAFNGSGWLLIITEEGMKVEDFTPPDNSWLPEPGEFLTPGEGVNEHSFKIPYLRATE